MVNLQIIKDIAEQKNIPLATIASELGITPQALSKLMRNNSTKIDTLEKIAQILKVSATVFFDDSANGEMLKSNVRSLGGVYSASQKDDVVVMIDFVPVSARASFLENLDTYSCSFEKFPIIPKSNEKAEIEKYKIFEVDGDSMYPTISDGALILAKIVPESSWHYAEGVVVAVFSDFVVVKRISRNELLTSNILVLASDNEKYGQMTVQLADIRAIYKAKRIISSDIR